MIFARIAFQTEVPSPRAVSFARSNWISTFDKTGFIIQRDGDNVFITCRETGLQLVYPWANVAAAESEARPKTEREKLPEPRALDGKGARK